MGAGAALAMETADVTLLDSNLEKLEFCMRMGRAVISKIKQNIVFSLVVKLTVLGFAIAGKTNLWAAIGSDVGAMLIVTLNAMLLLPSRQRSSDVAQLKGDIENGRMQEVAVSNEETKECTSGCCGPEPPAGSSATGICGKGCCEKENNPVTTVDCQKSCCESKGSVETTEASKSPCCGSGKREEKVGLACQKGCCGGDEGKEKPEGHSQGRDAMPFVKQSSCSGHAHSHHDHDHHHGHSHDHGADVQLAVKKSSTACCGGSGHAHSHDHNNHSKAIGNDEKKGQVGSGATSSPGHSHEHGHAGHDDHKHSHADHLDGRRDLGQSSASLSHVHHDHGHSHGHDASRTKDPEEHDSTH